MRKCLPKFEKNFHAAVCVVRTSQPFNILNQNLKHEETVPCYYHKFGFVYPAAGDGFRAVWLTVCIGYAV
jgi:hypothetical protein